MGSILTDKHAAYMKTEMNHSTFCVPKRKLHEQKRLYDLLGFFSLRILEKCSRQDVYSEEIDCYKVGIFQENEMISQGK